MHTQSLDGGHQTCKGRDLEASSLQLLMGCRGKAVKVWHFVLEEPARRAYASDVLDHPMHGALSISSQTPPRKTILQTVRLKVPAGTTWFRWLLSSNMF